MHEDLTKRLKECLDDWTIRTIGIVDSTTFLVVADWDPKDNPKKKFNEADETFWTAILTIDIKVNAPWSCWRKTLDGGLGKCYLDGGYLNGHKEASIVSYNGISYFIDYTKDTFECEGILKKIGVNDVKLIGNHFYIGAAANKIYRRDGVHDWTFTSTEARADWEKHGRGNINAIDGFNEQDMYFAGEEGLVWHYDGEKWRMVDVPANYPFTKIICAEDEKVYLGGRQGQLLIGRGNEWKVIISSKQAETYGVDMMHSMVYFKDTLYAGMRHDLMKLHKGKWISANIEGVLSAEFLACKDGVMLIGSNYSLDIYDGKEIKNLYINEGYIDAMFVGNKLLEIGSALLESGHGLLNELEKGKK
jgi:hypothetical protein